MRAILISMAICGCLSLSGPALAQTPSAKPAPAAAAPANGPDVSAADVAAVAVYREAMGKLRRDVKAARADVQEKNIALAKALGKGNDFSEKEVVARHADLMAAQQRLSQVELNGFLIYKKYNPTWKPDVSGKKVGANDPRSANPASAAMEALEEDEM